MQEENNDNIKVFVSDVSNEVFQIRKMLKKILLRAGMELFYLNFNNNNQIYKNQKLR